MPPTGTLPLIARAATTSSKSKSSAEDAGITAGIILGTLLWPLIGMVLLFGIVYFFKSIYRSIKWIRDQPHRRCIDAFRKWRNTREQKKMERAEDTQVRAAAEMEEIKKLEKVVVK